MSKMDLEIPEYKNHGPSNLTESSTNSSRPDMFYPAISHRLGEQWSSSEAENVRGPSGTSAVAGMPGGWVAMALQSTHSDSFDITVFPAPPLHPALAKDDVKALQSRIKQEEATNTIFADERATIAISTQGVVVPSAAHSTALAAALTPPQSNTIAALNTSLAAPSTASLSAVTSAPRSASSPFISPPATKGPSHREQPTSQPQQDAMAEKTTATVYGDSDSGLSTKDTHNLPYTGSIFGPSPPYARSEVQPGVLKSLNENGGQAAPLNPVQTVTQEALSNVETPTTSEEAEAKLPVLEIRQPEPTVFRDEMADLLDTLPGFNADGAELESSIAAAADVRIKTEVKNIKNKGKAEVPSTTKASKGSKDIAKPKTPVETIEKPAKAPRKPRPKSKIIAEVADTVEGPEANTFPAKPTPRKRAPAKPKASTITKEVRSSSPALRPTNTSTSASANKRKADSMTGAWPSLALNETPPPPSIMSLADIQARRAQLRLEKEEYEEKTRMLAEMAEELREMAMERDSADAARAAYEISLVSFDASFCFSIFSPGFWDEHAG